jgi:Flp pilus assembly pilin Flp
MGRTAFGCSSAESRNCYKGGKAMKKLRKLYEKLNARLTGIILGEKGQTMIEYALVVVLIAIVLVLIFKGAGVDSGISKAGAKVSSALQ